MNRYAAMAILGLGLIATPLVADRLAQGAVPANQKIGVIDIERTLYDTPAGKRASEAFDKNRQAKQAALDKQQKDLQKASEDLDKQASVLKPDVLKKKRDDLERKFVELQQTYVKLERELAQDRAKLVQDLLKQASPKVAELAKAEGVTIVIDQSAVLWADSQVDLTDQLNAKMK